jgi:hypothetical protein
MRKFVIVMWCKDAVVGITFRADPGVLSLIDRTPQASVWYN